VYLILRRRFGDPLATPLRWAVVAAAVAGGALGAKILFWLEDPQLTAHSLHNPAYLVGAKTIVGALVFGLISVELTKRYIGLRDSAGDLYAIPLALGIAIGRIRCFLTGLSDNTYGTPTHLPWAVNFGDGIPRHPTQLYEILFLLALIPILYRVLNKIQRENKVVILSEASASQSEADAQSKDPYLEVCHFEGAGANATASRETRCSSGLSPNQKWQPGDAALHGRLPILPPALRLHQTLPTHLPWPRRNSVGLRPDLALLFAGCRPLGRVGQESNLIS
jgi:hypothetical protein